MRVSALCLASRRRQPVRRQLVALIIIVFLIIMNIVALVIAVIQAVQNQS